MSGCVCLSVYLKLLLGITVISDIGVTDDMSLFFEIECSDNKNLILEAASLHKKEWKHVKWMQIDIR